jgi:hypothetical protein
MTNLTFRQKVKKVMYHTIKNWDDDTVLVLWHRTCNKLKEGGESEKCNGIIDACWDVIQERDLLPPAG